MNYKFAIGTLTSMILLAAGYFIFNGQFILGPQTQTKQSDNATNYDLSATDLLGKEKNSEQPNEPRITITDTDTIPADWKTYTNEKYGFSFRYPTSWVQQGKEAEYADLSGKIQGIEVYFLGSATEGPEKTNFTIIYRLPPNGTELYQYAVSQYENSQGLYSSGKQKILVAGKTALKSSIISERDGKGRTLKKAIRSINIIFTDEQEAGEFELQFQTTSADETIQLQNLRQLLASFQLI